MHFINLQSQYQYLKSQIDNGIQRVLDHGHYIMGPEVIELEELLAEYVGVKHAVSCANGTDALQLSLMALGVMPGDAVFCPTFTFFATAEAIAFIGATPVFVDSEKDTFNISPFDLEKRIGEILVQGDLKPKAIISVDLFGLPANYLELERIAELHGLQLIEDAAQGFGGEIKGRRAGSFGDIATTSFFPAKPLGCYGDGGAVFTNNDEYAEILKSLRIHGKGHDKYDNIHIGMNSRLDTIQAAILIEKLKAFPEELDSRNRIAAEYEYSLGGKFITPKVPADYVSSWAQYTLIDQNRGSYINKLKENDIPCGIYYGKCMHQQTAFRNLGYGRDGHEIAERLSKQVFSLPMHPYMENKEIELITSILNE